jgi:hypothetical protein
MTKKWKTYLGGHTLITTDLRDQAEYWQQKRIGRVKFLRKALGLDGGLREDQIQKRIVDENDTRLPKRKKRKTNNGGKAFRDATRQYRAKRTAGQLTFIVERK